MAKFTFFFSIFEKFTSRSNSSATFRLILHFYVMICSGFAKVPTNTIWLLKNNDVVI